MSNRRTHEGGQSEPRCMGRDGCLALGKLFATAGPRHWFPERGHTRGRVIKKKKGRRKGHVGHHQ